MYHSSAGTCVVKDIQCLNVSHPPLPFEPAAISHWANALRPRPMTTIELAGTFSFINPRTRARSGVGAAAWPVPGGGAAAAAAMDGGRPEGDFLMSAESVVLWSWSACDGMAEDERQRNKLSVPSSAPSWTPGRGARLVDRTRSAVLYFRRLVVP